MTERTKSPNDPDLLLELLAQNPEIAKELPETLSDLAAENNVSAELVIEGTTAALTRLAEVKRLPHDFTEILPDLYDWYPELAPRTIEPLSSLVASENPNLRREAIRCLGFLGTTAPADSDTAAAIVADGLADGNGEVRQATLWSLTKIGLVSPSAITPWRDEIADHLNPESTNFDRSGGGLRQCVESRGALRRYATEALAVNALGDIDIDAHRPADDQVSDLEASAAWAIQRNVADRGLPGGQQGQTKQPRTIEEDHGIASAVAGYLANCVGSGAEPKATGAVFALGCLAPGQDDMHEYIKLLNDVIDQEVTSSDQLSTAAEHVLTRGPFAHTTAIQNPKAESTVELKVIEPKDGPQSQVDIPYDVERKLFNENRMSAETVEISGNDSAFATIGWLIQEDGCIGIESGLRETLGVEIGDTVTIQAAPTIHARKVVLGIPDNVSIPPERIDTPPVRQKLGKQRFTTGNTIFLDIITDTETLREPFQFGRPTLSGVSNGIYDVSTTGLPVHVCESYPDTANRITGDTEIVVEQQDGDAHGWKTDEKGFEQDELRLFANFQEEVPDDVTPQISAREMLKRNDGQIPDHATGATRELLVEVLEEEFATAETPEERREILEEMEELETTEEPAQEKGNNMIEEFKEVKEKDTTLMDSYAENPGKLRRLPEETQKMVIREACIPREEVPDDVAYPDENE